MLNKEALKDSLGVWDIKKPSKLYRRPFRCKFEAGVGDLLIVRQRLKAYELADFAHTENVLIGEAWTGYPAQDQRLDRARQRAVAEGCYGFNGARHQKIRRSGRFLLARMAQRRSTTGPSTG